MTHRATSRFWRCYHALPASVQELADRCFALLKADSNHSSLHFKKIGQLWSARVGLHYRALAIESGGDMAWFWIGSHSEYDRLIKQQPANKRLQPTAVKRQSRKGTSRRRG